MSAAGLTLRRLFRVPYCPAIGCWVRWASSPMGAAILLAGATALRLIPWLASYPLHRDEALYGYWARLIATGADPLLLTQWVDKPPLVLYLEALAVRLFGPTLLALRFPGLLAGVGLVAATRGLATRLFGEGTGFLAAMMVAASPFAILFAPTAFTDSWVALFMIAAAWAAAARCPWLAGIVSGLAIASKQQGLLALPLVLALLWAYPAGNVFPMDRSSRLRGWLRSTAQWAGGLAIVLAPLFYWDQLRWATRPSFWDRSLSTYGGLGFAPFAAWPRRAYDWATQTGLLWGVPLLSWVTILGAGVVTIMPDRRKGLDSASSHFSPSSRFGTPADRILVLFIAAYLLMHFLLSFQTWDRYLLPLVPVLAIVVARAWRRTLSSRSPGRSRTAQSWALVVFLALLLSQARSGVTAAIPVGSDHGAYTGLERVISELRIQPADAVIYHRWLGWHYDFYLYDAPQERRWWGNAWKLADDAARTANDEPWRSQWIALPGWEDGEASALRLALASRRLELVEVLRTLRPDGSRSFTLFRIETITGASRG